MCVVVHIFQQTFWFCVLDLDVSRPRFALVNPGSGHAINRESNSNDAAFREQPDSSVHTYLRRVGRRLGVLYLFLSFLWLLDFTSTFKCNHRLVGKYRTMTLQLFPR